MDNSNLYMITIDIVELFPSIPHGKGMEWFGEVISKESGLSNDLINLIDFMNLVLNNNFICFNEEKPIEDATEVINGPEIGIQTSEIEIQRIHLCVTLQERLLYYYKALVSIPEPDVKLAKQLALSICGELRDFLFNKHPELPLGELYLGGSLCDDLQVISPSHVNLFAPLLLEENLWRFIPGEMTILNTPQFWMIKRANLEYFPNGSSRWDKWKVGGYLSSKVVIETFHKIVTGTINWPAIGSMLGCVVRPVVAAGEVTLEVRHDYCYLSLNILPLAKMEDRLLLATPHSTGYMENMWYRSFYTAEISRLKELDSADAGSRACCLKIFKSIFKQNTSLNKLSGSHLVTVLLQLSETQSDWTEEALADRFQEVIEELISCLERGVLPCYFNNKVNLFSEFSEEEIDEMGYTLYCALSEPDILLQN
ncbi:mitochondrial dynamics protein MID49 [Protopterus annectens]|uniref:mitochondrial dynamics protein MID49 n=1 Tax=Protopterus annectens TaxID=7888 RepID=UPI001CFC29C6|nr:mitochondrial dynamics protein MID49 [Protopterus annectens]